MAEIDLTKMSSAELVEALIKDNSLASEFDHLNLWEKFDSLGWHELLKAQPQYTEKAKEFEVGWPGLLSIKPKLANECKCWEKFYSFDWINLLKAQPQFADKCTEYKGWRKFFSLYWRNLLSSQPQLWIYCPKESINKIKKDPTNAKECKCWENFYSWHWSDLLKAQPQFANKCNWSKMRANNYDKYDEDEYDDFEYWKEKCGVDYSEDWKNLLFKQPQLAEYFTDVLWDGFSQENWEELEAKHPGVFEEKHMLSTLRKLARD